MNELIIGTPYHPGWSFVDWLLDLLNVFNKDDEDRGDNLEEEDDDDTKAEDEDLDDPDKDPDDEDEEEDPDDKDEKDDKKDHMIPKSRYDSASKRASEAETENTNLRKQVADLTGKVDDKDDTPSYEEQLVDLDRKIEEARADNDIDAVVKLNADKRTVEDQKHAEFTTATATETQTAAQQQTDFDLVVANLEQANPLLNPDEDAYDEQLVTDIIDLQIGWVNSGKYSPAEAMRKAAAYFLEPTDVTSIDKKKTDVKKNLNAASKMPPDTGDKGANSDKGGDAVNDAAQIGEMTQAEFDALPESTKSRLRGDAG